MNKSRNILKIISHLGNSNKTIDLCIFNELEIIEVQDKIFVLTNDKKRTVKINHKKVD